MRMEVIVNVMWCKFHQSNDKDLYVSYIKKYYDTNYVRDMYMYMYMYTVSTHTNRGQTRTKDLSSGL